MRKGLLITRPLYLTFVYLDFVDVAQQVRQSLKLSMASEMADTSPWITDNQHVHVLRRGHRATGIARRDVSMKMTTEESALGPLDADIGLKVGGRGGRCRGCLGSVEVPAEFLLESSETNVLPLLLRRHCLHDAF